MLRDEAVARIQRGLGFRTDKAAEIISALQEAQRLLQTGKTLPRFLLTRAQPLAVVAGTATVALPDDFLRRATEEPDIYYQEDSQSIPRWTQWRKLVDAAKAYEPLDRGAVQIAVLETSTIRFYPTPDQSRTVYWNYYKKAALLTTNVENEWLDDDNMPEAIIGVAGGIIARDLSDDKALALFMDMESKARISLFSETILADVDDGPMAMGSDN